MTDPANFLKKVIDPGCAELSLVMGQDVGDDRAKVLLLAIAMQESDLEHRRQISADGQPMDTLARGFWQFESGGGVAGVCNHQATTEHASNVCELLEISFDTTTIHDAIAWNDRLALTFARLLLFTDPAPLPAVGDEQGAWDYYIRNWRPGKPHRENWSEVYPLAVDTVNAENS